MPKEVTAVQCVNCKKLHVKEAAYVLIHKVSVQQKVADNANAWTKDHAASVQFEDVIVCDDNCLVELVTMGRKE